MLVCPDGVAFFEDEVLGEGVEGGMVREDEAVDVAVWVNSRRLGVDDLVFVSECLMLLVPGQGGRKSVFSTRRSAPFERVLRPPWCLSSAWE